MNGSVGTSSARDTTTASGERTSPAGYLLSRDLVRVEAAVEADFALDRQEIERTTTASAERTSSAGGSLVSELERLAVLYRHGALTADEFSAAKQLLLLESPNREV